MREESWNGRVSAVDWEGNVFYRPTALVVAVFLLLSLLCGCNHKAKVDDDFLALKLNLPKQTIVAIRRSGGLSSQALLAAEPAEIKETVRELKIPDLPQARAHYEQLLRQNEFGRIPIGAPTRAIQRLNELKTLISGTRFAVAGVPVSTNRFLARTAGLDPEQVKWIPLGPSEVGGRTRSIVFNPRNPQEMWIGSVAGGIWHSADGGVSFSAVDDFMKNLVISTIVSDPSHPNVMYAGTGEGFLNVDALRGAGIFRTEDGLHWLQIPTTDNEHFRFVNRLAFSSDGGTLIAATGDGIFISTDSDHKHWTEKPVLSGNIAEVVFHPTDIKLVLASGGMDTGEVYHSEDGGLSWQMSQHDGSWFHVSNGSSRKSRAEIVYALADPRTVYASVDTNNGEIWRSTDGGKVFSKMESGTEDGVLAYYLGEQGWYDNAIWAGDVNNVNFLVVGGINLWKSYDGGKTLSPISNWREDNNVLHPDQHVVVSPPVRGTLAVFVGNDGGLFKTDDITVAGTDKLHIAGWSKLGHKYTVTQFYGAAWSPQTGMFIGGAQDNGTLRLAKDGKPEDWTELYGGDGGNCAADPTDGKYLYGEYVNLNLFRSSDSGNSAEEISGEFWNPKEKTFEWKEVPYVIPDARDQNANFIAPFVLDPNNGNTIIAGGASLWRTDDAKTPNDTKRGPTWRSIKPAEIDTSTNPPSANFVSAIGVSKKDSRVVWVGHNNGDIFVTRKANDAKPTWKEISGRRQGLPARIVMRIVLDPVDLNIVYVTYGGYDDQGKRDNVWKTTDGGITWINLSRSLPSVPAFALTINPQNRNYVYLGTEVGLFASEDMGLHWSPTSVEPKNEGPTNAAVMDLIWANKTLVAVTHGRGMFMAPVNAPRTPK